MAGLICERCGGPLPKEAARAAVACTYCGTVSTPAPAVIEKVVERVRVVEGEGRGVHCPRCGGLMHDARTERVRARTSALLVCRGCGGTWLDPASVERITRQLDDDLLNAARLGVGAFAPPSRDRRAQLECPFCRAALARHTLGESGQSYDVCGTHGTFFDDGELRVFYDAEIARRTGEVSEDDVAAAGVSRGWRWPWS